MNTAKTNVSWPSLHQSYQAHMNFVTGAENAALQVEEQLNDYSRKEVNKGWSVRSSLQYREEEQEKDECF